MNRVRKMYLIYKQRMLNLPAERAPFIAEHVASIGNLSPDERIQLRLLINAKKQ